ncbi:hypothetical protein EW146_g9775 [Bondarzewia mesenterica]|uniref:DUF6589 domain-containing protein n=1 Tax=Bondarzewia mesenterica TaxID=1095465 RepID=A0A4S4L599_9AGAM|nr:hypothetical protein EW146_g9775 [Bondarzewia mesenterica]
MAGFTLPGRAHSTYAKAKANIIAAFAYSRKYNSRNLESYWYGVYEETLTNLVDDIRDLVVMSQPTLWYKSEHDTFEDSSQPSSQSSHERKPSLEVDQDVSMEPLGGDPDTSMTSATDTIPEENPPSVVPDFAIYFLKGRWRDRTTLPYYGRGFKHVRVVHVGVPVIIEVKRYCKRVSAPKGSAVPGDEDQAFILRKVQEGMDQAIKDAGVLFRMYPEQKQVILCACSGPWWNHRIMRHDDPLVLNDPFNSPDADFLGSLEKDDKRKKDEEEVEEPEKEDEVTEWLPEDDCEPEDWEENEASLEGASGGNGEPGSVLTNFWSEISCDAVPYKRSPGEERGCQHEHDTTRWVTTAIESHRNEARSKNQNTPTTPLLTPQPPSRLPSPTNDSAEPFYGETAPPKQFDGDWPLANCMMLMRNGIWFLEYCKAVALGDIGRTWEVIKLLIFTFAGAGNTNYTAYLVEMYCNITYDYPEATREALFNNWLVNLQGQPGHFLELDLMQEHFNFWLEELAQHKGKEFDDDWYREVLSMHVHHFIRLTKEMEANVNLKEHRTNHVELHMDNELREVIRLCREHDLHVRRQGRDWGFHVSDDQKRWGITSSHERER